MPKCWQLPIATNSCAAAPPAPVSHIYETGNIRLTTYENKVGYGVKKVGAGMGNALKARLVARGCCAECGVSVFLRIVFSEAEARGDIAESSK